MSSLKAVTVVLSILIAPYAFVDASAAKVEALDK